MPAKFQLKKGPTGKYRFVVLASNGQVVATSEAYERKASALAGIRSIEKIVQSQAAVEDTTTKEYAAAEEAKKAAKKGGAKKSGVKKVAKTAKKLVTKAADAAPAKTAAPAKASASSTPSASSTKAAKAAVKGAAKSGTRTPVRKAPPPLTTPPSQLTPKI